MEKVKTCVYAISLNEIKHVDLFMEASREADLILVCDTGSTDGTPERLRELGAVVYDIHQKPWRFDLPRNTALSLIPSDIDICLSIDLDEYLQPGWSNALNDEWQKKEGKIRRINYDYIWNWLADGTTPDVRFFADKIHHRYGYRWRHPCHETLYWEGEGEEHRSVIPGIILHHRADPTKSRGQYLPLLKLAVDEDPKNDRMSHYYGRELMFRGEYEAAILELKRHLSLPTSGWKEERCSSMRFIARCYRYLKQLGESIEWAIKATLEWPHTREPWLELARSTYDAKDWHTCYWAISRLLEIKHRTTTYMGLAECWGPDPYDIGCQAAWYSGLKERSRELAIEAYKLNPKDARLRSNCIACGISEETIDNLVNDN
jgi:glycosyltransferase involved in cell wall biosynthesis